MIHFSARLVALWDAVLLISDKLIAWGAGAVRFVWHWFLFAFDKFVDVFQWIAHKL